MLPFYSNWRCGVLPGVLDRFAASSCHGALVEWSTMSEDNQIRVPESFTALFVAPGRIKPREPFAVIAERHDFCEDLAQMMTEHAKLTQLELGIAESDVLERVHQGLLQPDAGVSEPEAGWVVRRLAELLYWPCPAHIGVPPKERK
jgi:hypothetical protein